MTGSMGISGLSFGRILFLLRNRILDQTQGFINGAAVVLGLNAISLLVSRQAGFNHGQGLWNYVICLTLIIAAGLSFKDMHSGKSGTDWILLPATSVEKYLSVILDRFIVLPLALILGSWGMSALLALLEGLLGGRGGTVWFPLSIQAQAWASVGIFALLFLAGSAFFRKAALAKTAGLIVGYVLAVLIVLSFAAFLILGARNGFDFSFQVRSEGDMMRLSGVELGKTAQAIVEWTAKILWFGVTPLFAFAYGLARVGEKEARDEVQ